MKLFTSYDGWFSKKTSSDRLATVKINCSYFPFMLMMLLPTHGEDQQTPQTISTPVMMMKDMTMH